MVNISTSSTIKTSVDFDLRKNKGSDEHKENARPRSKIYKGTVSTGPNISQKKTLIKMNEAMLRMALDEVQVEGEIPAGGAVVCSNHPSFLDGPVVFGIPGFQVRPIATDHGAVRNLFLRSAGCIMTKKGQVVNTASEYVKSGENVWIAPAGTTHEDLLCESPNSDKGRKVRSGAVAIAMAANKPLVPMAIDVEASSSAAKDFRKNSWSMMAATLGIFGGLNLIPHNLAGGATLLGTALLGARQVCTKKKATIKVKIGSPVDLVSPESSSAEANRVAVRENCSRMAKSINRLQIEASR